MSRFRVSAFRGGNALNIIKGNILTYEIYKIYNINVAGEFTNDKILLKEFGILIYLLRVFLPNKQTNVRQLRSMCQTEFSYFCIRSIPLNRL
jgi:predicted permease